MGKQTNITIETDSLMILRIGSSLRAWCPHCAAEREMIVLEEVGAITNSALGAVEAWLESEALHRLQTAEGTQLICLNSLLKCTQKPKTS